MRRRAFDILCVLSLLVALLAAGLWARSVWWAVDVVSLVPRGDGNWVVVRCHAYAYIIEVRERLRPPSLRPAMWPPPGVSWGVEAAGGARLPALLPRLAFPDELVISPALQPMAIAVVPHWIPIIPGVLAGCWFVRGRQVNRRGHCPACGYDLRGSSKEACPECGAGAKA